jgi:hypothetical protein
MDISNKDPPAAPILTIPKVIGPIIYHLALSVSDTLY